MPLSSKIIILKQPKGNRFRKPVSYTGGKCMEDNILSGGIQELQTVKATLLELNGYKENNHILSAEEKKLEKNIQNKEKAINDEILSTIKKRKEEIEITFNDQVDKTRSRIKKVRNKKEKSKNVKISERITVETAELREDYSKLKLEAKTVFKQNQVPSFCNTRLYYALYLPKGFGDIVIIGIMLLLVLIFIPCAVYFLFLQEKGMIYLALDYVVTVVLFGGLYMLVDNNTKDKHAKTLLKVREIRSYLAKNKKEQNNIRKQILRDKDESSYGLEKYNEELQELENEINTILEQRKDALEIFENTTRFVIGEEIKARYQEELTALKEEYDRVSIELKKTEGYITTISMEIARNYEAYMGKEFIQIDKLEQLEEQMKLNNLLTISDAIALLKQEEN